MQEIKLTQGKIALVDDEDYERLNQFKWCANRNRKKWYAQRGVWINSKVKTIKMHRVILNTSKEMEVDHINGDGLDNRKLNLRNCSNQQNQCNRRLPHKNNKLGIKGVRWNKNAKKFHAKIQVNGKTIHLGYFNVLGDADSAYRKAEEKYFGEFARKGELT